MLLDGIAYQGLKPLAITGDPFGVTQTKPWPADAWPFAKSARNEKTRLVRESGACMEFE